MQNDHVDYDKLTDREWSKRADRHAREALTKVGYMADSWDQMVQDNRLLQSRLDALQQDFNALLGVVGDLIARDQPRN